MDLKLECKTELRAATFKPLLWLKSAYRVPAAGVGSAQWVCVACLAGSALCSPASAQSVTPASAASAPAQVAAPSESVQRQADSVFRWIKIHADKPRKAASKHDVAAPSPAKAASAAGAPVVATAQTVPTELSAQNADELVLPVVVPLSASVVTQAAEASAAKALDVEVKLKPIAQPKPDFPGDVMAKLGKGAVTLRFVVQPDGTVSAPEILSSSHRRLNPPALAAIALWRFEPVQVARTAQVELGFDLD